MRRSAPPVRHYSAACLIDREMASAAKRRVRSDHSLSESRGGVPGGTRRAPIPRQERKSPPGAMQPERDRKGSSFIFFLTFIVNNLIYESHCDFFKVAKFDVRENQSMKSATKK